MSEDITTSDNTKLWIIIVIQVALMLERIVKNITYFKCGTNGISCGSRTPPATPDHSADTPRKAKPIKRKKRRSEDIEAGPARSDEDSSSDYE